MAGKSLTDRELDEADYISIKEQFEQLMVLTIRKQVQGALESFIKADGEKPRELLDYFSDAVDNVIIRWKHQ